MLVCIKALKDDGLVNSDFLSPYPLPLFFITESYLHVFLSYVQPTHSANLSFKYFIFYFHFPLPPPLSSASVGFSS